LTTKLLTSWQAVEFRDSRVRKNCSSLSWLDEPFDSWVGARWIPSPHSDVKDRPGATSRAYLASPRDAPCIVRRAHGPTSRTPGEVRSWTDTLPPEGARVGRGRPARHCRVGPALIGRWSRTEGRLRGAQIGVSAVPGSSHP